MCSEFEPVLLANIHRIRATRAKSTKQTGGYQALRKAVADVAGGRDRAGQAERSAGTRRCGFSHGIEMDIPAEGSSGTDLFLPERGRERTGDVQQSDPDGAGSASGDRRARSSAATPRGRRPRTSICVTSIPFATSDCRRRLTNAMRRDIWARIFWAATTRWISICTAARQPTSVAKRPD